MSAVLLVILTFSWFDLTPGSLPDPGPAVNPACTGDPIWEARPDGGDLLAAQDDPCLPFASEVADDFDGDGSLVVEVSWWGGYWNGEPDPPDAFRIVVYAVESSGAPGIPIHTTESAGFTETPGEPMAYCMALDPPFRAQPDTRYRISITAVGCFPPQWGWATGMGNGEDVYARSALQGYPLWVRGETIFGGPHDVAFVLHREQLEPTIEMSWARVKAVFR